MDFTTAEFANFRLACKEWNKMFMPIWRKNAQNTVHDFNRVETRNAIRFNAYMDLLRSCKAEEDPKKDIYQLGKRPFRKFKIQQWRLKLKGRGRMAFWGKVGPKMKNLLIQVCDFEEADDFKRLVFELTPNFECLNLYLNSFLSDRPDDKEIRLDPTRKDHLKPENVQKNLKTLEFHGGRYGILPISWIQLFAHFPNLEKMTLTGLVNEDQDSIEELEECLNSMEIVRDNLGPEYFVNLMHLSIRDV